MRLISTRGQFCALALALLASNPTVSRATALLVTPSTVSNLYLGNLTFQITGLTNGETVLVERYLDLNGNGLVDSGEPLVQSFRLTDGQLARIGGVSDGNIPGDDDASANGQITAHLSFAAGPEFSRGSGSQIFRLSSPTGRFAAVLQTFTVTQFAYAQQITGTVTSGSVPVPFAIAGVLVQVGTDNQFVSGAVADATGNFSLSVSNGAYQVVAFKAGYVGNFATSPAVVVSGANTNVTVPLSVGNFNVSGTLTETGSGLGIPGVQFFAGSDNNDYAVFFSDAPGNFHVSVIAGQWKLEPSDAALGMGGYLRPQNKPQVTVSASDVTGMNIQLTKGTALIYGSLRDDHGSPLGGVLLNCNDNGNSLDSSAITDAAGTFYLEVTNGIWYLGVSSQSSGLPPGYILQQAQVTITDGQAIQTNLTAQHATARLAGHATDSNSNAIGGGMMIAWSSGSQNASAQLGSDGSFDFPLTPGTWTLSLESQTAASRSLVSPQLQFNLTDGLAISNISYVAPIATRTISGWVKTGGNAPIAGINVFAGVMINGTNYNANATTDSGGNYSFPVLPGIWGVGVDSQGLAQRGLGIVFNQNADTSGGNQTVNFVVPTPPVGALGFRHSLGVVGEFGNRTVPTVAYPVMIRNHRLIFHVFNDTNPPAANTVLFTGPPGSGLTNSPADPAFGTVQDGTNVYYFSVPVRNPPAGSGGNWSVSYRTNANNFNQPDPQAYSRILVPLPSITVSNGLLLGVSWSYKNQNGNPIAGTPPFVLTNRIDLLDQNGNLFDSEIFPAATSYSYPATNRYHWSDIGGVRVDYYDDLGNQYFVAFNESSPSLTGASRVTGQGCQFLLNGPPLQNYTIQFSTNLALATWNTLYITNSATSPILIVDPNATNASRFYRVLVGP